jgi:hydroxymethylpyrimidine pyrophosphatase-like HAD family hydrolase
MIVVIDIDGTVANNDHRAHHIETKKPDWEAFLQPHLVAKDTLVPGAKKAIEHMATMRYKVVFLTGRHEGLRPTTTQWIQDNLGVEVNDDTLIMRNAGNLLKASEYKREQAQALRTEHPMEQFLFIDDDKYSWGSYADIGVVLKAPECWDVIFPKTDEVEPADLWRR